MGRYRSGRAIMQTTQFEDSSLLRYRVYVGTGDARGVALQAARYFPGATVFPVIGIWRGVLEGATVVEVLARASEGVLVQRFADDVQQLFEQEAVLVTHDPVECAGAVPAFASRQDTEVPAVSASVAGISPSGAAQEMASWAARRRWDRRSPH